MRSSDAVLAVFVFGLRGITAEELETLWDRFVQLDQDPAEIAMIEAELERREL